MSTETVKPVGEQAFAELPPVRRRPRRTRSWRSFAASSDEAAQREAIDELQELFDENAPVVPLFPGPRWGALQHDPLHRASRPRTTRTRPCRPAVPTTVLVLTTLEPVVYRVTLDPPCSRQLSHPTAHALSRAGAVECAHQHNGVNAMRFILQPRLGFYLVAFWVSVTLNFLLPRFMPGDPISRMMSQSQGRMTAGTGRPAAAAVRARRAPDLAAVPQLLAEHLHRRPGGLHLPLPHPGHRGHRQPDRLDAAARRHRADHRRRGRATSSGSSPPGGGAASSTRSCRRSWSSSGRSPTSGSPWVRCTCSGSRSAGSPCGTPTAPG